MFREEDYLNPEEPLASVEAPRNGCVWAGYLYERKTGGFDLFYDHANSDFKPLEIAKITMLRHMVERGEDFIAHLAPEKERKKLVARARELLLQWVMATVGD